MCEGSNQGGVPRQTIATSCYLWSSKAPGLARGIPKMWWYVGCQTIQHGWLPKWYKNLVCTVPCGKDFLIWPTCCVKKHLFFFPWTWLLLAALLVGLVLEATVAKGIKLWSRWLCAEVGSPQCHLRWLCLENIWSSSAILSQINSEPCAA